MKFKVAILAAVLTLGFAGSAFSAVGNAAWLDRQADGTVIIPGNPPARPNLNLKPSANVFFSWAVETTGVAYSIGALHTSGTFTYATSSTDTNIYRWANSDQSSTSQTVYSNTNAAKCPASPNGATGLITWVAGWTASK